MLPHSAKAGEGVRWELYHKMGVTLGSLCNGWGAETSLVSLSDEPSHFGVEVSWKWYGSPSARKGTAKESPIKNKSEACCRGGPVE